jgi:hypothetical protein
MSFRLNFTLLFPCDRNVNQGHDWFSAQIAPNYAFASLFRANYDGKMIGKTGENMGACKEKYFIRQPIPKKSNYLSALIYLLFWCFDLFFYSLIGIEVYYHEW